MGGGREAGMKIAWFSSSAGGTNMSFQEPRGSVFGFLQVCVSEDFSQS